MDYTETLNDPTLLLGFNELLRDPDVQIVKRTIRVFANVYNHSLRLMAEDQICEQTLLKAWPYLSEIIDNIFAMFESVENEGVLLILVKFLECSVDRHLISDFSKYSEISHKSRDYIKRGLRALKDLVSTPYVGGSVFIVAVKAIIRIACHREDLYEPATNLVKNLLASLPPTLFHHNVRSFHKILQHNLFKLLKKSNCPRLKKTLINMMVSTGASRRALAHWTPKEIPAPKRKIPQQNIDDVILGRVSPPEKRSKLDDSDNMTPSQHSVDILPKSNPINLLAATPQKSSLDFLTSLIPKPCPAASASGGDLEKQQIYDSLSTAKISSLILSHLPFIPDDMPDTFARDFSEKTVVSENLNVMRSHLASMLVSQFSAEHFKLLSSGRASPPGATTSTINAVPKNVKTLPTRKSDSSMNDVDMRGVVAASRDTHDIDMRVVYSGGRKVESKPDTPPLTEPTPNIIEEPKAIHLDFRTRRDTPTEEINTSRETVTSIHTEQVASKNDIRLQKDSPRRSITPEQDSSQGCDIPVSDGSRVGARVDPRLRKMAPSRNTPSPQAPGSPLENMSAEHAMVPTRKDPRLLNRATSSPPNGATEKENVRTDPRMTSENSKPRDHCRGDEDHYISHNNAKMLGHERINNVSNMIFSNNTSGHMLYNPSYPGTAPLNLDRQNQFQHNMRDPLGFRPRFDQRTGLNHQGMYQNYNNIGPMNNFNNRYQYCPQGRFQQ